jgi:hypothetical protein
VERGNFNISRQPATEEGTSVVKNHKAFCGFPYLSHKQTRACTATAAGNCILYLPRPAVFMHRLASPPLTDSYQEPWKPSGNEVRPSSFSLMPILLSSVRRYGTYRRPHRLPPNYCNQHHHTDTPTKALLCFVRQVQQLLCVPCCATKMPKCRYLNVSHRSCSCSRSRHLRGVGRV